MNKINETVTGEGNAPREQYIRQGAIRCATSQGYSIETGEAFAEWAMNYCPEVQSFSNLFDCYMSQQA